MSAKLAEILGARLGDEVQLEVLEGRRPVLTHPHPRARHRLRRRRRLHGYRRAAPLMREGDTVNGAYLAVDHDHWATSCAR